MMKIPFTKMHGIGNDYLYIDCTRNDYFQNGQAEQFARQYSDRHFGVGSDGVILIKSSETEDFAMDMYNADGSRGAMCGNGIRCLARYVHDRKLTSKKEMSIETLSGPRKIEIGLDGAGCFFARVNMGKPSFQPQDIPVIWSEESMINEPLSSDFGLFNVTAISMGNPHAVVFIKDVDTLDLAKLGPGFEHHRLFPEGVNTEFVEILSRDRIRMRVWERGSGETMACGTGACAAVAAAAINGLADRVAEVVLNGGNLHITWEKESDEIIMIGPAEFICDGVVEFDPKETK